MFSQSLVAVGVNDIYNLLKAEVNGEWAAAYGVL